MLTPQEKEAFGQLLSFLLEADSPIVMISTMRQIAERMTQRGIQRSREDDVRNWCTAAEALERVEREIDNRARVVRLKSRR
jgi:hypothetical protein